MVCMFVFAQADDEIVPSNRPQQFLFCFLLNDVHDHIDVILQLYREEDLHEEKNRISQAFGAICDEGVLKKVLQFALSVSYAACLY